MIGPSLGRGLARRALLGPFAWESWGSVLAGLLLVGVLTGLTEVGGVFVWPALGLAAGRWRTAALLSATSYGLSLLVVPPLAAMGGRVALPCTSSGPLRPRSLVYCLAHRRYVRPALAEEVERIARQVAAEHPGTQVRYLDGSFPFLDGVPLLPQLSHHDGRKLDLALLYEDEDGAPLDGGGSPIGYFGYVPLPNDAQPACAPSWLDLRWDLDPLQPLLAPRLDVERTASLVRAVAESERIGKILLEPHLQDRLAVRSDKLRFQGCHAARHDDHVHIQLR